VDNIPLEETCTQIVILVLYRVAEQIYRHDIYMIRKSVCNAKNSSHLSTAEYRHLATISKYIRGEQVER